MKSQNLALVIGGIVVGLIVISAFLGVNISTDFANSDKENLGYGSMELEESLPSDSSSSFLSPKIAERKVDKSKSVSDELGSNSSSSSLRLVIKKGEANLVVDNISSSAKKIKEYSEKQGGWIVSSNITGTSGSESGNITVRVPVLKFDDTMEYMRQIAEKVEYEKTEGQDVTEEYTDLNSELKNLEATEEQFLEIMKKAKTIDEILKVQKELKSIRGDIEYTKGQMQYLERSSEMSTITAYLALSENLLPVPESEKWKPGYVAKKAWQNTVQFWKNVSYGLIEIFVYHLLTWIVFLAIITLILWKPAKALLRKFECCGKKKKNKAVSKNSSSGLAVASMIIGVVGVLLVFSNPGLGFLAGLVALIFGVKEGREGYSKAGFILGIIVLVIAGMMALSAIFVGDPIYYMD